MNNFLEDFNRKQIEIYKNMSSAQKLAVAMNLYHSARSLKTASLKKFHPNWSAEKINIELKKIFMYART